MQPHLLHLVHQAVARCQDQVHRRDKLREQEEMPYVSHVHKLHHTVLKFLPTRKCREESYHRQVPGEHVKGPMSLLSEITQQRPHVPIWQRLFLQTRKGRRYTPRLYRGRFLLDETI